MTNTKSLILDAIKDRIATERPDLTVTDDHYAANVGTLRTVDRQHLTQVASATYDFQHTYCHFGPMSNRIVGHWYGVERKQGNAPWVAGSLGEVIDIVVKHLTPPTKEEA